MNVLIAFIDFVDEYVPKIESFLKGWAVAAGFVAVACWISVIYSWRAQ